MGNIEEKHQQELWDRANQSQNLLTRKIEELKNEHEENLTKALADRETFLKRDHVQELQNMEKTLSNEKQAVQAEVDRYIETLEEQQKVVDQFKEELKLTKAQLLEKDEESTKISEKLVEKEEESTKISEKLVEKEEEFVKISEKLAEKEEEYNTLQTAYETLE